MAADVRRYQTGVDDGALTYGRGLTGKMTQVVGVIQETFASFYRANVGTKPIIQAPPIAKP